MNWFRRNFPYILLAIVLVYFVGTNFHMLQNNLWNDEIYTLKKFTLGYFKTTLTDYHSTNNHIFYNVFNHFYLKAAGINDLKTLFEKPWVLRLPLLLLALLTLIYAYRFGKLAGEPITGLLMALLLATTVPFENFSMQVRGYAFSIFFDLALAFYLLNYLLSPKPKYLFLVGLLSFLAVYTIPLNLYCIMAIIGFLCMEGLWVRLSTGKTDLKYLYALLSVLSGIVFVLICFIPIRHVVFNNEFVNGERPFNLWVYYWLIPVVLKSFASGRFLLIDFALVGAVVFTFAMFRTPQRSNMIVRLLFLQMIIPFLMVYVRGEFPADRTFVYMVPFYCALLAIFISVILRVLPSVLKYPLLAGLAIYLLMVHTLTLKALDETMSEILKSEKRSQTMSAAYFLHNFYPLDMMHYLKQPAKDSVPLILMDSEPHDIPDYLNAFNIPFHGTDSLDYFLQKEQTILLITRHPAQLNEQFQLTHCCNVEPVFKPAYHHLLKLSWKGER